jgi:polyisoprenoid-binding protein YceI
MQFRSTAVAPSAQSRHVVRGLLEFDGVTRLQALDLAMSPRRQDAITGTDVVDLTFTGRYREMALGIPLSDRFISNALDLRLAAAVELEG